MGVVAKKIDGRVDDLRALWDAARAYLAAKDRRDAAVKEMDAARDAALVILDKIDKDRVAFADAIPMRYAVVRVKWDAKGLIEFIRNEVSPKAARLVAVIGVDERALERLIDSGDVNLEDVQKFVIETKRSWGFTVKVPKGDEAGEE